MRTALLASAIVAAAAIFVIGACADEWVPPTYNSTVWEAFAAKTLLNPFARPPMGNASNPYAANATNTTWPDTVCAVSYPDPKNRSHYYLRNFESRAAAEAAGAFVTHQHPCSYCSTTQDLAVYMKFQDLTLRGKFCGFVGFLSQEDGIKCFRNFGFTEPCAWIWYWDTWMSRTHCFAICMKYLFAPNNLPPNSTTMNPCIACDEYTSGPVFKVVAGRTRRDSGLKSSINRPADQVYHVTHYYY